MAPRPLHDSTVGRSGRVCVAQVGGAHGIRGEVRLRVFTEDPAAVGRYGLLEDETGQRRFEILSLRAKKDVAIARIDGIADRSAAEALRNIRLYVPRARLAAPEEDEYYHADLIGLAVLAVDGSALGTVVAVQNFGAGDLLEVAPAAGGSSVLLPFTKAVVPTVDLSRRRVIVDPPDGVFEARDTDQKGRP